jgi:branched-chain amino acid aminotransferase
VTVILWFDGALRDPDTPLVRPLDHGFTVGDGVFETCELVGGKVFALTRHLARLGRSADGLGLRLPPEEVVRGAVAQVADAWAGSAGDATGRLRITVTGGPAPLGSDRGTASPTLVVAASAARPPGPVRVHVVPWTRNERSAVAGLKTTSYAENVVALARAHQQGADEAIFANSRDELCEGSFSNVLVETPDALITPPLSSGCLAGVTRELVLEWAAEAGLPVREATSPISAIRTAAHAAITSSLKGVVPIVAVDGRELAPGPLTMRVAEMFDSRRGQTVDP